MSSIYIHMPKTRGKVILKTNYGDLNIDLWSKESPRTCRNFVQLCLENYYDNCIIFKMTENAVFTGDPTGTGLGGESSFSNDNGQSVPFATETHSRLKFIARGLLAMASEKGYNKNGSQFFITLKRCEEKNLQYPIFGRISDHSIFNLLRISNLEVDANQRPLYPPKILSTEVLENPFDDIVPRVKVENEVKKKKGKKRNFSLLSFDDDNDSHEVVKKVTYSSLYEGRTGKGPKNASELKETKSIESLKDSIRKKMASEKNDDVEGMEEMKPVPVPVVPMLKKRKVFGKKNKRKAPKGAEKKKIKAIEMKGIEKEKTTKETVEVEDASSRFSVKSEKTVLKRKRKEMKKGEEINDGKLYLERQRNRFKRRKLEGKTKKKRKKIDKNFSLSSLKPSFKPKNLSFKHVETSVDVDVYETVDPLKKLKEK